MAYGLLLRRPMLVSAAAAGALLCLLAGCVVPIPADSTAPDGGSDLSAPIIVDSTPPMPMTDGPITITGTEPFTITVKDNDLADTIYVRVFRDYQKGAVGPFNDTFVTNDKLHGSATRVISLPTNTWCNLATRGSLLVFDVVVADRPFLQDPSVAPAYRALPPGAESSIRSWIGTCPP